MTPIDLDRRFVAWKKGDGEGADADPELWARYRLSEGTLQWSDLLKRRRVVVLAGGLRRGDGSRAFIARLQDSAYA